MLYGKKIYFKGKNVVSTRRTDSNTIKLGLEREICQRDKKTIKEQKKSPGPTIGLQHNEKITNPEEGFSSLLNKICASSS